MTVGSWHILQDLLVVFSIIQAQMLRFLYWFSGWLAVESIVIAQINSKLWCLLLLPTRPHSIPPHRTHSLCRTRDTSIWFRLRLVQCRNAGTRSCCPLSQLIGQCSHNTLRLANCETFLFFRGVPSRNLAIIVLMLETKLLVKRIQAKQY